MNSSFPKFTFYPLAVCIKYWNTVQMYIIQLFLATFSNFVNVCNKTSLFLTNRYRSLHCVRIQYIADFFLCRPLKRTTTCGETIFAVDVTIYQTYIDKTFAQTIRYPGDIIQLLQSSREYCPFRILQAYIQNWQSFLHQNKEVCTFATGGTACWVCYPLPIFI